VFFFLSSIWLVANLAQVPSALTQGNSRLTMIFPKIPPTARTIEKFRQIKVGMSMEQLRAICGEPDADIGSGVNIYVYNLSDGSSVTISGGSTIFRIRHSKPIQKISTADRSLLLNTAQQFYRWQIENDINGLPSAQQLLPIQNLLAPKLVKSLDQAKLIEVCLIKSAPVNIKPAIFEGSLFADNYEGVSKVNTLSLSGQGDTAIVTATLEYTDQKQASTSIWIDQIILKKKADQWLIEDVRFPRKATEYSLTISKTLMNILAGYIKKHQNACNS
jgi:hypothetical protein